MRLTLRTLLAYLDDTMEPAEIKEFGKRVAESDAAQELIARIRQITRRRRLTAPANTGPGGLDPNTVAEYLDNELPSDQVSELEKTCLESDLHLAELAAVHQILTLVLGQPALVPPTARERMYALVQGREAIPFRKASASSSGLVPIVDGFDEDYSPPGSLPFGKSLSWLRWALPLLGLVLLLGVGIYLMMNSQNPRDRRVAVNKKNDEQEKETPVDKPQDKGPNAENKAANSDNKSNNTENKGKGPDAKDPPADPMGPKPTPPKDPTPIPVVKRPSSPSAERVDIAVYNPDPNPKKQSILVQRRSEGWKRLTPENRTIFTREPLVSLPGFASEVQLNSGVNLLLRGNTPEFSQHELMDLLLDSAVILHQNTEFEADMTLLRGRVYVSTRRPDCRVRLRFSNEVWDLVLKDSGTEVGLDLLRNFTRDSNWRAGEEPRTEMYLCVLKGKASLKIDTYFYNDLEAPPGAAVFMWDNEGPRPAGPQRIGGAVPPIWAKDPPISAWKRQRQEIEDKIQKGSAEDARNAKFSLDLLNGRIKAGEAMLSALDLLAKTVTDKGPINISLVEGSQPSKDLGLRLLCIYAMSAIDDVGKLIDILASESTAAAPDRDGAIFSLRRWLSRSAEQGKLLYHDDGMKKTGLLLVGNRYTPREAERILSLLHDFNSVESSSKETFEVLVLYLANDKLAIRELARWHLLRLSQRAPKIPPFDAASAPEIRAAAVAEWDKMVKDGLLPPPQMPDRQLPSKKQ